jgi:fatty acid amide hydrolase
MSLSVDSLADAPWKIGLLALIGLAVVRWIVRWSNRRRVQAEYARLIKQKRAQCADRLESARSEGLSWEGCEAWAAAARLKLSPAEVIELTAFELLGAMERRELSAEYVMRCFIGRAMEVGETLGCVTEQDFETALREAAECDLERARGSSRGRLHGLPISIKEQIKQEGFDSTCGACCRLFAPAEEDAVLVAVLREAGAIPFARTNVPQLLMLPESFNAIYGVARNPYDLGRTPGGSSGGESALVAARASPLGVGTDVGGSIRIPATFTGITGLKPTVDRLSMRGVGVPRLGERNGQKEVRSAAGPMARSVADLELMMDVCCSDGSGMHAADSAIPPLGWDHAAFATAAKSKLRFGYFVSDGWFEPAPSCARAVHEAVEALKAAGHEVVAFAPEELAEAAPLYVSILAADGNFRSFINGIEGEALHPNYRFLYNVANIPAWLRPLIAFGLGTFLGQERKAKLVRAGNGKPTYDYWQAVAARDALKAKFVRRFEAAGLDALICPGLGLPAFPHNSSMLLNQACSYTFVWNNFNLPAGAVPVTTVRADEQAYQRAGDHDKDEISAKAEEAMRGSAGLPVGVQVVGAQWRDEQVLGAMQALETALLKRHGPPAAPPGLPTAPKATKAGKAKSTASSKAAPAAASPFPVGATPSRRRAAKSPASRQRK